jgi:phosphatidylglycerol lysyltransferase
VSNATAPTDVHDDHPADATVPSEHPSTGRWVRRIGRLLARYWATTLIVAMVLVAGIITGALWNDVEQGTRLFDQVAYGLPALQDNRPWTFFTGMLFSPQIIVYVPILVLLVLAASTYERRVGSIQTLVVAIGGQFLAALLTALLLWPFDASSWTWAVELGRTLDLGISAGGFTLVGALTAVMQPVWQRRVRIALGAYLVAMVLNAGLLWDVEHLIAFALGVFVGPFLAGRMPALSPIGFGPRTQRATMALVIAVSAISGIVEAAFPGNGGPFRSDGNADQSSGVTVSLLVASIVLLAFADGLRRGRRIAWAAVTGLLAVVFIGLFSTDPSAERTADFVLTGTLLILLVATAPAFTSRAPKRFVRSSARRLLWVVAGLFVYTAVGFFVLHDDFSPAAGWPDVLSEFVARLFFTTTDRIEPVSDAASWFVGSIGAVWVAAIVITVISSVYATRKPTQVPEQDARLRALLQRHHSSNIQWMLTWEGITVWFSDDGDTAIGFELIGSVALCLADPVGPIEQRGAALEAFDAYCFARGWIPCLFAAGQDTADVAATLKWKSVEVAEDSVMSLDDVEFKGKSWQDVRTAINKAGKQDIELLSTTWADCTPVITDQLQAISGAWVSDKPLPEMGFTLGTLREARDPEVRLHIAIGADRTIEGFTSWMPVSDNGEVVGWTLDLMRRRDHGFRPVMEYLIGAGARQFADEGYRFLSLSAAPLAKPKGAEGNGSDDVVLQQLLTFIGDRLEPYYGFQSLFRYKEKFQPEHHPMYLVFPDETALAEIGLAVVRAYVPDAGFVDWIRMGADMFSSAQDEPAPAS